MLTDMPACRTSQPRLDCYAEQCGMTAILCGDKGDRMQLFSKFNKQGLMLRTNARCSKLNVFERLAQAQTQNTSPKEKPWAKAFH